LENIVNVGEMESEESGQRINKYTEEFDLECIDKIRSLMIALRECKPEEMNAWRGSSFISLLFVSISKHIDSIKKLYRSSLTL
jgi:hypothetical protein